MRFKIDENLPPEASALLRNHGHDALTVWDQGLQGQPDVSIAAICQKENRAFMTLDLDFADIRTYPPDQYQVSLSYASAVKAAPTFCEFYRI